MSNTPTHQTRPMDIDFRKYRIVGLILERNDNAGYPLGEIETVRPASPPPVPSPLFAPAGAVEDYASDPPSPHVSFVDYASDITDDPDSDSDVDERHVHPYLDFEFPAEAPSDVSDADEDDDAAGSLPPSPAFPRIRDGRTYTEGVDYLDSHIGAKSRSDNTSRRYLRDLFRAYYKNINGRNPRILRARKPTETDKNSKTQGIYYDIFVDMLKNEIYPQYNITTNVMTKHGKFWRIDPEKFAENGIKQLPLWMDVAIDRQKTGVPASQTAQQKEAIGPHCACHYCGWRLGEQRGNMILAPRHVHIDGVRQPHVDRKFHGRAPEGRVTAAMEVAEDKASAVFSCQFCHAARSNKMFMKDIVKNTQTTPPRRGTRRR